MRRLKKTGRDWRLRGRQGSAGLGVRDHLTNLELRHLVELTETHPIHHPTLGQGNGRLSMPQVGQDRIP